MKLFKSLQTFTKIKCFNTDQCQCESARFSSTELLQCRRRESRCLFPGGNTHLGFCGGNSGCYGSGWICVEYTSLRSVGSAACNMCNIAMGRCDAYMEHGIWCWDIAAGDIIIREAGGVVYDVKGGPLDLLARRVLCAGTEKLAKQISGIIEAIEYPSD